MCKGGQKSTKMEEVGEQAAVLCSVFGSDANADLIRCFIAGLRGFLQANRHPA
jgi:hypothetical protein